MSNASSNLFRGVLWDDQYLQICKYVFSVCKSARVFGRFFSFTNFTKYIYVYWHIQEDLQGYLQKFLPKEQHFGITWPRSHKARSMLSRFGSRTIHPKKQYLLNYIVNSNNLWNMWKICEFTKLHFALSVIKNLPIFSLKVF